MPAVENFRNALKALQIDEAIVARIMEGYETISDKASKGKRVAFFIQAVSRMDTLLDAQTCHDIRDACACSKGGWRLKAVQKVAKECEGRPLEEKIEALRHVTYMSDPVLNADGTITAGIGGEEGLQCPCPVFEGQQSLSPKPTATAAQDTSASTTRSPWERN